MHMSIIWNFNIVVKWHEWSIDDIFASRKTSNYFKLETIHLIADNIRLLKNANEDILICLQCIPNHIMAIQIYLLIDMLQYTSANDLH